MKHVIKFFEKRNGFLYGPSRAFRYEIGEEYTINNRCYWLIN